MNAMPSDKPDQTGAAATDKPAAGSGAPNEAPAKPARPPEFGGPAGPEPTRYGDWERNGRVSDF